MKISQNPSGEEPFSRNISLEADQKDHIGLVGANGAGKSTLFRLITGEELADEGAVVRSKELKLGIMEQFLCRDENATPYSMALGIFERLIEQEKLLKQIEGDIEKGNVTDELLERQQLVRESFEADGGLVFPQSFKIGSYGTRDLPRRSLTAPFIR